MSLLATVWRVVLDEFTLLRSGRRALKELRFRKYRIPQGTDRVSRERLLRRLPYRLAGGLQPESSCR